ncbi:MAG TPA: histidine phosphatase family protein [Edaphocola sp.]|nr:histidine phosphatase family protein [Edaphocola sp.]
MNKRFVIIRHAIASDFEIEKKDFDRSLQKVGIEDAKLMGKKLLSYGLIPDRIVASASLRTQQTAKLIADSLGYKGEIHSIDKLYNASEIVIEENLNALSEDCTTVFLIAHNPGVSQFVTDISGQDLYINMAPCSIAVFESTAEKWFLLDKNNTSLIKFDAP